MTLKNGALNYWGLLQGLYAVSDPINGKPTWTLGSHAIWYDSDYNKWRIGFLDDIGTTTCAITAIDDYAGLDDNNNEWKYWAGSDNGWIWADANDVVINCTSKDEATLCVFLV